MIITHTPSCSEKEWENDESKDRPDVFNDSSYKNSIRNEFFCKVNERLTDAIIWSSIWERIISLTTVCLLERASQTLAVIIPDWLIRKNRPATTKSPPKNERRLNHKERKKDIYTIIYNKQDTYCIDIRIRKSISSSVYYV